MKLRWKWMLAMALILCVLAGTGMAASRYSASSGGVVLGSGAPSVTSRYNGAGVLTVPVNSAANDWNALMLAGGNYNILVSITPPSGPAGYTCTGVGAYTGGATYMDDAAQKAIAIDAENMTSDTVFVFEVPAMEPDSTGMMLIPYVNDPSLGYQYAQVAWRFAKGSDIQYVYEKYFFSTSHTDPSPVQLDARYVVAGMLAPMDNASGVTAVRENGVLTLNINASSSWGFEVPLEISGPAGATRAELILWEDVYDGNLTGSNTFTFTRWDDDEQQDVPLMLYCNPTGNVQAYEGCMVKWYDDDGLLLDYGTLDIYTVPKEHEPFPAYLSENTNYANWYPVQDDQIHVTDTLKNCGVDVTVTNGLISIAPNGKTPSGNPGRISYSVQPPKVDQNGDPINEKLTWVRIHSAGAGDVYGRGKEGPMIDESYFLPSARSLNGHSPVDVGAEAPIVYYKAKTVDVYLQQNYSRWNAGVYLINWYTGSSAPAEFATPAYSQYLVVETERLFDYERDQPVVMVDEESDITSPVNYTTIVKPASLSGSLEGWALVSRVDLQNGEDAYHRELYTINETGAKNKLKLDNGETMVLYIPYPEDFAYGTDEVFYAYHYASENYNKAPERLVGENTPWGVRFEVTSLSPFVFSWADEAVVSVAANVPQTGDPTPLFAIVCMLALSFGGMLIISRKRQRV